MLSVVMFGTAGTMGAASLIAALTGATVKKGCAFTGAINLW